MKQYPLIGISIIAIIVLVLGSLSNVVGYQTVQSSNQSVIKERINQKELLFQTIIDIANNKEIQKVILGSEITGKRFFDPGVRFSTFSFPVITEKFFKRIYTMGVILSKTISKSKIQSLIEYHQVMNQGIQKELFTVIKKDTTLKSEMMQLSNLSCDCLNDNKTVWHFPLLCTLLYPLYLIIDYLCHHITYPNFVITLQNIIIMIGNSYHCFWIN